jgi:[ribosomal protein S5]-alanine N-acetyltransferase
MLRELETERLTLREMRPADAPALQVWQSNPTQWRQQAIEPEEFADAGARIARYLEHRGAGAQRRLFVYVAILKSTGAIVGTAGLSRSGPGVASLGVASLGVASLGVASLGVASLGLSVAASHASRGYGTEIAERLLAFGFEDLRLDRISADVAIENLACIRVLEKASMVREGVARDCIWAQGRWWTEAQYVMRSEDYVRSLRGRRCAETVSTALKQSLR